MQLEVRKLLFAFWLVASTALANATICFGTFAGLSSADKDTLTTLTYRQLLTEVGGAKLTPEIVEQMIKGKDPFAVPEGKEDLGGLRKHLREFKTLLEQNEWSSKQTRALLLKELKAFRGRQSDAAKRLRRSVEGAEAKDFEIPFKDYKSQPILSPDGKWVLIREYRNTQLIGNNPTKLVSVNVKTGVRHEVALGRDYEIDPVFTPDGKALLFANEWGGFYRVPFKNGIVNLGKSESLFQLASFSVNNRPEVEVLPTTNPNRFFNATVGGGLALFDLASNVRTDVKWAEYARQSPDFVASAIPGTDYLAVRAMDGDKVRLHVISVDKDGKVSAVGPTHLFADSPLSLGVAADGTVYTLTHQGDFTVRTASGEFKPLPSERDTEHFPRQSHAVPHPVEKHVVLVFATHKDHGNETSVEAFDLKTGQSRGANVISRKFFHDPVFFPDGKRLMWQTPEGNARIADSEWLVHPYGPEPP